MSEKHKWLFKTAQAEYTRLREDCITWIGLVFLDHVAFHYGIDLKPDETLVLTDEGLSQQMTGLGYGINLPGLPACKAIHYYRPTLVDDVLTGRADESTVTQTIKDFFKDYLEYAKVFIRNPNTFIKVSHEDLICDKPGVGSIETLKTLGKN